MTIHDKPAHAMRWSARTMAAAVGISEASVRRIWRAHGLRPHAPEAFKIGNHPRSAEKTRTAGQAVLESSAGCAAAILCNEEKGQDPSSAPEAVWNADEARWAGLQAIDSE